MSQGNLEWPAATRSAPAVSPVGSKALARLPLSLDILVIMKQRQHGFIARQAAGWGYRALTPRRKAISSSSDGDGVRHEPPPGLITPTNQ